MNLRWNDGWWGYWQEKAEVVSANYEYEIQLHTWVFLSAVSQRKKRSEKEKGEGGSVYLGWTGSTKHPSSLLQRENMCENSLWHTGKAIPASDLSYCAHFSTALRTPNRECATSSQKPDLQLALQVKTWVPQADSCCCFPLSLYPGKTQQKGRGTSLFLSL